MNIFLSDEGYVQDLMDDFSLITTSDELDNARSVYVGWDMSFWDGPKETLEHKSRFREFCKIKGIGIKNEKSN